MHACVVHVFQSARRDTGLMKDLVNNEILGVPILLLLQIAFALVTRITAHFVMTGYD